jgi:hypothetical protein
MIDALTAATFLLAAVGAHTVYRSRARLLARGWVNFGMACNAIRRMACNAIRRRYAWPRRRPLPPGVLVINARPDGWAPVEVPPPMPPGDDPRSGDLPQPRSHAEVRGIQRCPCLHLPDGSEFHTLACTRRGE